MRFQVVDEDVLESVKAYISGEELSSVQNNLVNSILLKLRLSVSL